MTKEDKIAYIRNIGDFMEKDDNGKYVDSDEVISAYLTKAETEIMNRAYPYGYSEETEFPSKYEILACDIVIYLMNKRGAEGQTQHSENGISRVYANSNIPADMLTPVIPFASAIGSAT